MNKGGYDNSLCTPIVVHRTFHLKLSHFSLQTFSTQLQPLTSVLVFEDVAAASVFYHSFHRFLNVTPS